MDLYKPLSQNLSSLSYLITTMEHILIPILENGGICLFNCRTSALPTFNSALCYLIKQEDPSQITTLMELLEDGDWRQVRSFLRSIPLENDEDTGGAAQLLIKANIAHILRGCSAGLGPISGEEDREVMQSFKQRHTAIVRRSNEAMREVNRGDVDRYDPTIRTVIDTAKASEQLYYAFRMGEAGLAAEIELQEVRDQQGMEDDD